MQFYDESRPRLAAGKYELELTQSVGTSQGELQRYSQTQRFEVMGPRFLLDADDLYTVYPPANAAGVSDLHLPHVLFSDRTLPWQRALEGFTSAESPPWLALLVFDEEDFDGDAARLEQLLRPERFTPALIRTPADKDTLGPKLVLSAEEEQSERTYPVIDVPAGLFRQLAPTLEELALLAHVRKVQTDAKDDALADGWRSVVLSNRLPLPGKRSVVHLVSVEGHVDRLGRSTTTPAALDESKRVRLVSIARWTFTCGQQQPIRFSDRVKALNRNALCVPPPGAPLEDTPGARTAASAIQAGYVALAYTTREGEETTGWYRGPLSPRPMAPPADGPRIHPSADGALIIDPESGLFDVSLAVAWELGRQLALSDGDFADALADWRSRVGHEVGWMYRNRQLLRELRESLDLTGTSSLSLEELREKLRDFLVHSLGGLDGVKRQDALGLGRVAAGLLPGQLEEPQFQQLLTHPEDPALALVRDALFGSNSGGGT
jgi:hypothetical protein